MKKPLSPLFLLIPCFIFLLSLAVSATPGGLLSFYLIGIVFCLPSVAFSETKYKWFGIAFSLIFVILSFIEVSNAFNYHRRMYQRFREIETHNQKEEPSSSPNPLPPSALEDR
jgi:bacteriorhodopsin